MAESNIRKFIAPLLIVIPYLVAFSEGLKCRTYQEVHENNDLEYVVRMCLRHMNNETDFIDQIYKYQGESNSNRNRNRDQNGYNPFRDNNFNNNNNNNDNNNNNHNNDYNGYNDNNDNNNYNGNSDGGNYYYSNQDKGYQGGFDGFWSSGNKQQRPNDGHNNGFWNEDPGKGDGDYGDESDYYNSQRGRKQDDRNKQKSRPSHPHSYQQQMQHDRESMQNHGSKNSAGYFFTNRKQTTNMSHLNRDKNSDSPLADIEPCVIHCIFQEMKMVDNNGKPNKELISQKMTQKIRNPELKNFIRESVEECYELIESNSFGNYGNGNANGWYQQRNQREMCEWAKTFAICLENRGKDNCDDWNDPTQKSKNSRSNNNSNNSNNNNKKKNNNSNNSKNNDNSKNKSNQNEMG